jgi:sarcosine oxidase
MTAKLYDVAVVGLGAYGASALMHLAQSGIRVVGIDQFSPPHEMGSSHGETRITRESIAEGAQYIECVQRSHVLWRMIESEAGVDILRQCGGIIIDINPTSVFHGVQGFARTSGELAKQYGITHELLSGREAKARFPGFAIGDGAVVYFEPGAGFVRPEVAIEAQLRLAQKSGAVVQTEMEVCELQRVPGGGVRIIATSGTFEVGACLLTAGAWVKKFLPVKQSSIFTVTRQVLHWMPIQSGAYNLGSSPIFIWDAGDGTDGHVYGFPSLDGVTIKVATEVSSEDQSPDTVVRSVSPEEQMRFFNDYIARTLSYVSGPPSRSKVCLYTVVPESRFVVEQHPEISEVLVASCCSGHGFKHSAAIGEALAARLRGKHAKIDLSTFRRPDWLVP